MIFTLIGIRIVHFYAVGWHYYLIDFCYYGNYIILASIMNVFGKDQDKLFKVAFLFGNGVLARSVYLFRNSLVYHKIDVLTSLGIHLFPFICMYHFKWYTIEEEAKLPIDARTYVTPLVEDTWSEWAINMLVIPVCAYFFWLINYSLINFVIAKDNISKNSYDTLYQMFGRMEGVQKWAKSKNMEYSPPLFMFFHFALFFLCHLGGVLAYHSFWFNTFIVCLYTYLSIWNGACFYMDYFSKKYEKVLQDYEAQYKQVTQTTETE